VGVEASVRARRLELEWRWERSQGRWVRQAETRASQQRLQRLYDVAVSAAIAAPTEAYHRLQEGDQRAEPGSAEVGDEAGEGKRGFLQRVEVRLVYAPIDPREVLQKAVGDGHGERIAREKRRQALG